MRPSSNECGGASVLDVVVRSPTDGRASTAPCGHGHGLRAGGCQLGHCSIGREHGGQEDRLSLVQIKGASANEQAVGEARVVEGDPNREKCIVIECDATWVGNALALGLIRETTVVT